MQGINSLTESVKVLQQNHTGQDSMVSSSSDGNNGGGVKRGAEQVSRGPPRGKAKPMAKPPPPILNVDARLTLFQNRRIGDAEQGGLENFL